MKNETPSPAENSSSSGLFADSVKFGLAEASRAGVIFALFPIAAFFLDPRELGVIAFAETIGIIVSLVSTLGLPESLTRLYFGHDSVEARENFIATICRLSLGLALGISVLLIGLGAIVWNVGDFEASFGFVVMAVVLFTSERHSRTYLSLYQAEGSANHYLGWSIASGCLNFALVTSVLALGSFGATGWFGARIAASLLIVAGLILFNRHRFKGSWVTSYARSALEFTLPLVPHLINTQLLFAADRLLLEYLTDLESVGIYSLFYNLGLSIYFITTLLILAWSPRFYTMSETRPESAQMGRGNLAVMAIICASAVLAPPVLHMIAAYAFPQYSSGLPLIPWVVLGYLFHALYSVMVISILHSRMTRLLVIISGLSAAANLALNMWLIPEFDMLGAAIATVAAFALSALLGAFFAYRVHPIDRESGHFAAICTLATLAILVAAGGWLSLGSTFALSIGCALIIIFVGRVHRIDSTDWE